MQARQSWWRRVGWLLLLWAGGVACVSVIAMLLKLAMRVAGLA